MSASQTIRNNTPNTLYIDSDISKLARGNNEFITATYINTDTTNAITLNEGTVLGRITEDTTTPTNVTKVREAESASTDGSEYPVGLLYLGGQQNVTIPASGEISVTILNKGRIDLNLLFLVGTGDTLDTVIPTSGPNRTYRTVLDDMLVLEDVVQVSTFDN